MNAARVAGPACQEASAAFRSPVSIAGRAVGGARSQHPQQDPKDGGADDGSVRTCPEPCRPPPTVIAAAKPGMCPLRPEAWRSRPMARFGSDTCTLIGVGTCSPEADGHALRYGAPPPMAGKLGSRPARFPSVAHAGETAERIRIRPRRAVSARPLTVAWACTTRIGRQDDVEVRPTGSRP